MKADRVSSLGWRIILGTDAPSFLRDAVVATADCTKPLVDALPKKYRKCVLDEAKAYEPPIEEEPDTKTHVPANVSPVKVTSFEGAKGLSSQHVYIAGLHDGELLHDPTSIKDLEICKFVVGLTRTRKKCTLICTRNFAGQWKSPSSFISWINPARLKFIKVDAKYWKQ